MIKVNIVKLGSPLTTVTIEAGQLVSDALTKGSFDLDSVQSVKRGWVSIDLDTTVNDWDMLMISQEKIKWGNILTDALNATTMSEIAQYGLEIVVEEEPFVQELLAFEKGSSAIKVISDTLDNMWVSLDRFKRLEDSLGREVDITKPLTEGAFYKVVVK